MLRDCAEALQESRTAETDSLRRELFDKDGSPWGNWNLTTHQMKKELGRYGIKPKTVRVGGKAVRGYHVKRPCVAFRGNTLFSLACQ